MGRDDKAQSHVSVSVVEKPNKTPYKQTYQFSLNSQHKFRRLLDVAFVSNLQLDTLNSNS